jgi:hypothetical protein
MWWTSHVLIIWKAILAWAKTSSRVTHTGESGVDVLVISAYGCA